MSDELADRMQDPNAEGATDIALAPSDGAEPVAADLEPLAPQEWPQEQADASGDVAGRDVETILDIPVTLSIEIGRTRISIRHLMQLNQGSVVELDRLAGEPLDVLVNATLVAHGEVVVVNDKFGIRLTDVISAQERVKKLR